MYIFNFLWSSSVSLVVKEKCVKTLKSLKFSVQGCLKILLLVFHSLKMHENIYIYISFWKKKGKPLYKSCHIATETVFSTKFVVDAKVQNGNFWNILN